MNDKIKEILEDIQFVIDEDDCLDPFSSIDYLKEDLKKEEFDSVQPCDILYCRTEVQHLDDQIKSRPMVDIIAVERNGIQKVKGFQITTEPRKTITHYTEII